VVVNREAQAFNKFGANFWFLSIPHPLTAR